MQWQKQSREPVELSVKIQVDVLAMQKLWLYTLMAKGEVSCLGLVDQIMNDAGSIRALRVTDFFLVKQTCTDAETSMDSAAVAQLLLELEQNGADSSKVRCWAHSHSAMSCFWSEIDHETISGLANGEWLLSLVVNKKHDSMMRLDQYNPCHLWVSDVVWEQHLPHLESLEEACTVEFKEKVTEASPLSRWKVNGRVKEQIEDLQAARERNAITEEDLREEMNMITYGDFDFTEDDVPF